MPTVNINNSNVPFDLHLSSGGERLEPPTSTLRMQIRQISVDYYDLYSRSEGYPYAGELPHTAAAAR